jgi:hypothetical protein
MGPTTVRLEISHGYIFQDLFGDIFLQDFLSKWWRISLDRIGAPLRSAIIYVNAL